MKRMNRMLAWIMALALVLTAGYASAMTESAKPKPTTEIEVDKDAVMVKEGKTSKVTVKLWAVGDADALAFGIVNEEGKKDETYASATYKKYAKKVVITIKGKLFGQTKLRLVSGDQLVDVPITVTPKKPLPPESVTLDEHDITLEKGKSFKLSATIAPLYANQKLTWSSSAKKIAAVNSKGKVTAKKPGTAIITVKTSDKTITDVCTVTVVPKGELPTPEPSPEVTPEPSPEDTPEPSPENTPEPSPEDTPTV